VHYRFSEPQRGAVLLAHGPHPVRDIESRYRQLLQHLVDRGRLTSADAEQFSPAIDTDVTDQRR
jgi:hypothetical protein